ncbi:hypothetical protein ACFV2U_17650 [Streptomyces sp. NPDC059697]|uniref:hypothetical protein n=1 Tax=Streptomyces sp. NPDC059697 TaxID=3346912 RepID=UPI0036B2D629
MTRRSHFQRLLLLAASTTVIAGGAVLPSSAMAATAAPHTAAVTTVASDHDGHRQHGSPTSAKQWVETTDTASGITFRLPEKPKVEHYTKAKGRASGRFYTVENDHGIVGFLVIDASGAQLNLNDCLLSFVDGYNAESHSSSEVLTSTGVHKTTVNGRPALDARLSAPDGTVGSARFIHDGDHYVVALSLGPKEKEKPMSESYQQLLASIHMPDAGATRAG